MNPPKMPIHIGDYQRDTGHLRAADHGAYLLLLFHYWSTGGLPDDDRQLSAIARMSSSEWRRSRPVIERFFKPGWKHSRVDYELEKAAKISEAAKEAGLASGRTRAQRKSNERSTTVEPTLEPSNHIKKDTEAIASAADAAPTKPVYTDSRHELWGEGVPILQQLGVSDSLARSNIGRWLKDTRDDAQAVLGAIQRARDNRVHGPIAWITNALGTPNGQRPHNSNRKSTGSDFFAGLAEVAADIDRDGAMAGAPDADIPSGRVNIEH